jgi:hypothetical protein
MWLTSRRARALLGTAFVTLSLNAVAGRSCEPVALTAQAVYQSLDLAQRAYESLDASGAQLALIARRGQDLTAYGLRYSHIAIVWRDSPAGRWSLLHELNECGSARSSLYVQGLGDFFLDDMFAYETLIIVPGDALQARLLAEIGSPELTSLHEDRYNMLAYPFSTLYQNSNQWVLELLAASLAPPGSIHDRRAAQAWLAGSGYRPTTLTIPALTRLGAELSRANIAFDDHPFDRRMAGQIDTVTVDSIARLLRQRDAEAQFTELRPR